MVDAPTLAELSVLAKRLNSQSNNLNKHIKVLNDQLSAMNLGLEYFLRQPIQSTGRLQDSNCSPPKRYEENVYLGYGKLNDVWQLTLKEETIDYEWNPEEREEISVSEYDYIPLMQAPRELRLIAVDYFDNLIKGLKQHVQGTLGRIGRAEEFANLK